MADGETNGKANGTDAATAILDAVKTGMGQAMQTIDQRIEKFDERLAGAEQARYQIDSDALSNSIQAMAGFLQNKANEAADTLLQTLDERIEKVAPRKSFIVVKDPAGNVKKAIGDAVAHPQLQTVIDIIQMGEIPLLVGPTGCGKTFLSKQVAEVLEAEFDGLSCSGGVTEGKLFGRPIPNVATGEQHFQASPWALMFEKQARTLYLLDEIDALDENVAISANMALANGRMPLPDRASKPFAMRAVGTDGEWLHNCIATANTWGAGADRQYAGRNQLDAATLDRFVPVDMDYSEEIEESIARQYGGTAILERFWDFRRAIRSSRLERVCSTRTIERACKQDSCGWDMGKIEETYFAGWSRDEIVAVRGRA